VFALQLWDPNALEASAPIEEFLNHLGSGEQELTAALRESVVLIHPWVSEPRASPPLGPDGRPDLQRNRLGRMKELSVRDMRANIGRLDELVAAEGELVICRHGRPIARVLPMAQHLQPPDHADLRTRMVPLQASSAELIRAERDER